MINKAWYSLLLFNVYNSQKTNQNFKIGNKPVVDACLMRLDKMKMSLLK